MSNRVFLLVLAGIVCAAGLAAMSMLSRKGRILPNANTAPTAKGESNAPKAEPNAKQIKTDAIATLGAIDLSHLESGDGMASGANPPKDTERIAEKPQESTGALAIADERAALVSEVLDKMKDKARGEISKRILSDAGDFLVALDAALTADKGKAHGDLPLLSLIDKEHSVGRDYVPKGLVPLDDKGKSYTVSRAGLSLRPEAETALESMAQAAKKDGVTIMASSTYRSYDYQKTVYEKWVRIDGQEEADRESARPGTSQHQLGCAVDFGSITDDFADTKQGRWVYAHAADWGWSLSFPREREDVTGYRWECWHFRYIGREACRLQDEWFCGVQQYMMEFIDVYKSLRAGDKGGEETA